MDSFAALSAATEATTRRELVAGCYPLAALRLAFLSRSANYLNPS